MFCVYYHFVVVIVVNLTIYFGLICLKIKYILQNKKKEYEQIINLLDYTPNQPTIFSTKNCVKINDKARVTYGTNSQIKFKTSMLKSSLCGYSDAYILVRGTITAVGAGTDDEAKVAYRNNKQVIFKNCAPFTDCITAINNTQVDNGKDLDVVQ